jgi:hypothetical protein
MPLSEHEQRLLEEMERNLYKNEADVVSTLGVKRMPNYRAMAIGAIVAIAGLVTMLAGVSQGITVVGILGFVLLFAGVMIAVAVPGRPLENDISRGPKASANGAQKNFMDNLNDRWDRRQGGGSN